MSLRLSLSPLLLATFALPFAAGCNPGEVVQQAQTAAKRDAAMQHLKELGLAFHRYHDQHWQGGTGKGAPESWEHLQEAGLSAEGRQMLEQEGYKLILGLEFSQATIGTSNFMIAYPAIPPSDQFLVGMMDGSVRNVDRAEFDDLLAQQQPLLAEAIVVEPSKAVSPATSSPGASPSASSPSPSPYVPPPPPSSGS